MSSTTNDLTINSRRVVFLVLIVLLSIVLPIGLIGWSIQSAILGNHFGRPSLERKIFQGCVKNGEFWYLVGTYDGKAKPVRVGWQIKRLDLLSGIERETDLELADDFQIPFLVNGEIYGSGSAISKVVGEKFAKVADWPIAAEKPGLYSYLFVENGQLTMISEIEEGGFTLLHLVSGQWVRGRTIRLPPARSEWILDPKKGHRIKTPEGSPLPKLDGSVDHAWVSIQGQNVHLFVTYSNGFAAYRNGFEFVDDDQDTNSALEPFNVANSDRDMAGWEPIQPSRKNDRWGQMIGDRDGVLVVNWHDSGRVVRRTNSGDWIDLDGLPELKHATRSVVVDPDHSAAYVLDTNELWNSAIIYRIVENTVQAPHAVARGCYDEYFGRWQFCFAGILLAWLLHLSLLTGGVEWIASGRRDSNYSFGDRHVTLASTPRRALACFADLLLLATIVTLLAKVQMPLFGIVVNLPSRDEFCRTIFEYDRAVAQGGVQDGFNVFFSPPGNISNLPSPWETFLRSISRHQSLFTTVIIDFLLLLGVRSYVEGRIGITPGKWLLRIRTLRTSLRPCGPARALVRSVLYWVDIPFFVTPITAAVSMVLSRYRQRIGDRVADTLVVDSKHFDLCSVLIDDHKTF